MSVGLATLAAAVACGVPGLPPPGAPSAGVPWPGADELARAAAAAPLEAHDPVAAKRGCLRDHLEEAAELNERRRPIYSAWTEGASEAISRRLIAEERRGLLPARYIDWRARRFQSEGIPIVCAEFIPMDRTPPLGSAPDPPPSISPPPGPDTEALGTAIIEAYGVGGFDAVLRQVGPELARLEETPMYHCMVRHLLESVARIAALSSLHEAAVARAGAPSTVRLSELLLRLHLAVLHDAGELDREAAPLQARGVPIICRDVPPIPYPAIAGEVVEPS